MKFICPLITVSDMARARRFYENVLGQVVKDDFGENVFFEGGFSIHLRQHFASLIDWHEVSPGDPVFELYFEDDDLYSLVRRLEAENVRFAHPLRQQPWKQLVVRFFDPDGNLVEAGEPLAITSARLMKEGLSPEEVAKAMGVSVELITQWEEG